MAKIQITPMDKKGCREVLVNGVSVPEVTNVSLFCRPGNRDEVTLTILADSFQSELFREED